MPIENRPYIGTWKLNNQQLVQHTPDALVYLNGDLSLPGCQKCSGKIDIQKFLTEVSVDAGTEAGSASATFSLSIPLHHAESFARDAQFILRPGLEVHIYMRGYFPVKGLFSNLAEKRAVTQIEGSGAAPATRKEVLISAEKKGKRKDIVYSGQTVTLDGFSHSKRRGAPTAIIIHESGMNSRRDTEHTLQRNGYGINYIVGGDGVWKYYGPDVVTSHTGAGNTNSYAVGIEFNHRYVDGATVIPAPWFPGGKYALPSNSKLETLWAFTSNFAKENNIPVQFGGVHGNTFSFGAGSGAVKSGITSHKHQGGSDGHGDGVFPSLYMALRSRGSSPSDAYAQATALASSVQVGSGTVTLPAKTGDGTVPMPPVNDAPVPHNVIPVEDLDHKALEKYQKGQIPVDGDGTTPTPAPVADGALTLGMTPPSHLDAVGNFGPSLLEEMGLAGMGVENTLAYPYYHVFHGVVTQVNHSYTGGVSTVSVTCNSMLHFWQYHNMSTNASVFGARPTNSKNKLSLVGNNFTGMHPYAIMYSLHYDMAGAAGGIGFALSAKSNQRAVSEGGDSLFSLNVQYWEKRFKRGTKLRMHAATGDLFTTMAAAWLSRKDSGTLTSFLRDRYAAKTSPARHNVLSEALAVGLWSGKDKRNAIDATRYAAESKAAPRSASFEINVLEMQAFVTNIGDWGQVNLFEASYESKLDVAQKVCQITGFEFYQDVDGDFVFKPPMWNLDTSASRVYRIEDIDLININFSEKEPQVTYMTCKGAAFTNVGGTGLENEWGVRGQYLDYRLIAQFGWRPGSFETAYFNDPKSMFFAAVNRMDVMNIATLSASATIPVRPELRPGYPVYIPYLDCFYYCNSFAHSHSVGGQCTTALQLVGKRAKFYAPGVVDVNGVDSIHLENTRLPEKPLQVVGADGKMRLSGFPNVVMALDPTQINPLFFVVGMDIEDISDVRVLAYMVQVGVQLQVIAEEPAGADGKPIYSIQRQMGDGTTVPVTFFFDPTSAPPKKSGAKSVTTDLQQAALDYKALLASYEKTDTASQAELREAQNKVNQAQSQVASLNRDEEALAKNPDALSVAEKAVLDAQTALRAINDRLDADKKKREAEVTDFDKKPEFALLLAVYKTVADKYRASAGYQNGSSMDLSSTINLLDMLSDKKATFSNGQQPGQYRYYSASHPDPAQQGPSTVTYQGRAIVRGEPLDITTPLPVVQMYGRSPVASFPGAKPPETVLEAGSPTKGIRVLTGKPDSDGEVLSTSDITELMFSVQDVTKVAANTSTKKKSRPVGISNQVLWDMFTQRLDPSSRAPNPTLTVNEFFRESIEAIIETGTAAIAAMKAAASVNNVTLTVPDDYFAKSPDVFPAGTGNVDLGHLLGAYQWEGNTLGTVNLGPDFGATLLSLGATMDRLPASEWLIQVSQFLAAQYVLFVGKVLAQVNADMRGANKDVQAAIMTAWNTLFTFGESHDSATEQKTTGPVTGKTTTYSPVFPVSDAKGYRVIGSYRYGRGVDIDSLGVFDQTHKADLFSLLDRNLVDQILRVFVQRGEITIPLNQTETKEVNGKKVTVPLGGEKTVGGSEAARYLNTEALRQLRAANLSDAQILDYSGAINKRDGDATIVDFSLANMFADDKRDGIMKVPVNNAAYSLADLGVQQAGHICDCKAAEASMLIEAFGQQQFLSVSGGQQNDPGAEPEETLNSWMLTQTEVAAKQWEVQQQALRGQSLDRGGSHVVQSFLDATGIDTPGTTRVSPFEATLEEGKARLDALRAEARKVTLP